MKFSLKSLAWWGKALQTHTKNLANLDKRVLDIEIAVDVNCVVNPINTVYKRKAYYIACMHAVC